MDNIESEHLEHCPTCLVEVRPLIRFQHGIASNRVCPNCDSLTGMYGFAGYLLRTWRWLFPPRPRKKN